MSRWDDQSTVWDQFFWDAPDIPQTAASKRKKTNPRIMASNPTPDDNDILRALADRIADGCHTLEVTIGIKQNTETVIRAAIAPLAASELQLGLRKADVDAAITALQGQDTAGEATLSDCKLRLAKKFGQRWSAEWEPTGFPDQSTAIPDSQDARFTLLGSLRDYFTAVPANESVDMGATAAICDAAWIALSDARQGVATTESARTTAGNVRNAAAEVLRKRIRGFIGELETLLTDDDARYEAFGLNIPANPSAPEPVASVAVSALGNGRLAVSWSYAVRATRYRVQAQIVGVDDDFANKASAKDLEVILKGYTAGQTVKVRVVAGNDGGDAAASPVAQAIAT